MYVACHTCISKEFSTFVVMWLLLHPSTQASRDPELFWNFQGEHARFYSPYIIINTLLSYPSGIHPHLLPSQTQMFSNKINVTSVVADTGLRAYCALQSSNLILTTTVRDILGELGVKEVKNTLRS